METEIILLIGIAVFLLIMFYNGFRKGAIAIALSIATTIVSIVLSMAMAGPIEIAIKNTKIKEKVNEQTRKYVEKYVSPEINKSQEKMQDEAVKELKLPESIQKKLINNNTTEKKIKMGTKTFTDYLVASLTNILIRAITVIALFIIFKVVLRIVVRVLEIGGRLPVIKEVNKSAGGIVGVAEGILIIWVACILLTAFGGTNAGQQIFKAISNNSILSFIYNNNILIKILL